VQSTSVLLEVIKQPQRDVAADYHRCVSMRTASRIASTVMIVMAAPIVAVSRRSTLLCNEVFFFLASEIALASDYCDFKAEKRK